MGFFVRLLTQIRVEILRLLTEDAATVVALPLTPFNLVDGFAYGYRLGTPRTRLSKRLEKPDTRVP